MRRCRADRLGGCSGTGERFESLGLSRAPCSHWYLHKYHDRISPDLARRAGQLATKQGVAVLNFNYTLGPSSHPPFPSFARNFGRVGLTGPGRGNPVESQLLGNLSPPPRSLVPRLRPSRREGENSMNRYGCFFWLRPQAALGNSCHSWFETKMPRYLTCGNESVTVNHAFTR